MTSRDFCFWLQGYLEITTADKPAPALTSEQLACVQRHLSLVFKHEIDPSMGPETELNQLHGGPKPGLKPGMRC